MSWLRIDDGFTEHRKVIELKRSDRWTWLEVLTYCARQGNATIPPGITGVLKHVSIQFLNDCISVGLIDVDGTTMTVHDWDTYNPKDATKAERQARWRAKNTGPVDGDVDGPVDAPVDGAVDENSVYKNVYETAPPPLPQPPPLSKGSTVTDYPYLPVVPEPVGGENEHGEAEPDRAIVVPDVLGDFPEPDPWDD